MTSYALLTITKLATTTFSEWKQTIFCGVGLMAILRLIRAWNQTGNKWISSPDIGKYLNLPENSVLLSSLTLATFFFTLLFIQRVSSEFQRLNSRVFTHITKGIAFLTLCLIGIKYLPSSLKSMLPSIFQNIAFVARLIYLCVGILILLAVFGLPLLLRLKKQHPLSLSHRVITSFNLFLLAFHLLALLLHKQHNLFLFVLFLIEIHFLWHFFDHQSKSSSIPNNNNQE
jgi:hypothetical protein